MDGRWPLMGANAGTTALVRLRPTPEIEMTFLAPRFACLKKSGVLSAGVDCGKQRGGKTVAGRVRIEFRCGEIERQAIREKAALAELTLSDYLRRVALGRVIPSATDRETAGELRRLGGMLKHLYPKEANWTAEEKRRYWAGHEQLLALARSIQTRIKGGE